MSFSLPATASKEIHTFRWDWWIIQIHHLWRNTSTQIMTHAKKAPEENQCTQTTMMLQETRSQITSMFEFDALFWSSCEWGLFLLHQHMPCVLIRAIMYNLPVVFIDLYETKSYTEETWNPFCKIRLHYKWASEDISSLKWSFCYNAPSVEYSTWID